MPKHRVVVIWEDREQVLWLFYNLPHACMLHAYGSQQTTKLQLLGPYR